VAAVRRIRKPGTKFDTMLIFKGEQGLGKSMAIARLCPDPVAIAVAVVLGAVFRLTGSRHRLRLDHSKPAR
jgi:Virulence-associated protein E-like domain